MKRILALVLGALIFGVVVNAAVANNGVDEVKVETRNIYLGASLGPILTAPPAGIPAAVDAAVAQVAANDFTVRVAALADEIALDRPHLIGIQEAALFRCQTPSDGVFSPTPNATGPCPVPGSGDYLADLLDEVNSHRKLVKKGLSYVVVASVQNADVEFPCIGPSSCAIPTDVRLTDRDVILARSDIAASVTPIPFIAGCPNPPVSSGVAAVPNTGCNYAAAAPAPVGPILRGFVGVTAALGESTVQFVNTHLEVQGPVVDGTSPTGQAFFQAAQASQLIATLSAFAVPGVPQIPVGDYNSAPVDPVTISVPSPPFPVTSVVPPYHQMTAAGFVDIWTLDDEDDPGFTSSQASDLSNLTSILDKRIDLIFANQVDEAEAGVVGDEPLNSTPNWASDHAGVVGEIELVETDDDDGDDDHDDDDDSS